MIPIKTPAEIEKMRAAGDLASKVLNAVVDLIAPGVTTGELDRYAGRMISDAGARSAFFGYRKFPGQLCISLNEEVVHGIGGARKVNYGDIVTLDCGVNLNGWIGDTAVTVPVGIVEPAVEKLLRVTEETLEGALKFAVAGRRLGDICAYIEEQVARNGYSVVREFVGHGVGRKLHEEPQIPNYGRKGSGPKLRSGMTLAIEPMVNMGRHEVRILEDRWTVVTCDGLPSAHFEHTILITNGQPEVLTWRRKTLLK
ncbi:MAG: type I methionyl aminopeptidase [Terrimicrobiaceae bacterium]|nr:type I methionyl aminopeptidase [Terrimicrobiaceae bacterium]